MKVVIYCRYSSELQNPKSCEDQAREIRVGLTRLGVDPSKADEVTDNAVSGTKSEREGFDAICQRIRNGEAFILAVDDQSRFTRLGNALALITDLVFAGGRFISTTEQIDTAVRGWKLKVRVMELHHSTCSDETGERVRRGQRGRVLDQLSAGDFPYGYESYPKDPEYAKRYNGRGPKPTMALRINRRQAEWVLWIFQQIAEGRSINWIARQLTEKKVPRDRRAWSGEWFAPTIRKMLSNEKYIGRWTWGKTRIIRDSEGNKKQIAVPDEVVTTDRPNLLIVPQELWEQVQRKLANFRQRVGKKAGQKSRAPLLHYTVAYPTDVLMTLLVCGCCGAKMHFAGSGKHTYRECSNASDGRNSCKDRTRVPVVKAKTVLIGFIVELLRNMPDWIDTAVQAMRSAIQELQSKVPTELEQRRVTLRETEKRRDHLMIIAESGGVEDLEGFKQRLREIDEDARDLRGEIEKLEVLPATQIDFPDNRWIQKRLVELADALLTDEATTAVLLRDLIGKVRVVRVVPVGKKFGYQQLRFSSPLNNRDWSGA